jgi:hypothetical protein
MSSRWLLLADCCRRQQYIQSNLTSAIEVKADAQYGKLKIQALTAAYSRIADIPGAAPR